MGDLVNLRRARKRKAREQAKADATSRRVAFGVSQADKQAARVEREFADRTLDAHEIVPSPIAGADDER